ncbi:MAG: hypothetical protein R3230_06195, partial [Nitrosopumilaceae archaeon]|nr:hypothetical protein [Nitrosopumilaceae archaeon]
ESQSILDQVKEKQKQAEIELQNTSERLKNARSEMQNLASQSESKQSEIGLAKKEMSFIASELSSAGAKNAEKHVVEAASAVVASMSQKLKAAQNELEILKKVLEKERQEHNATREKLQKLEKEKSPNSAQKSE